MNTFVRKASAIAIKVHKFSRLTEGFRPAILVGVLLILLSSILSLAFPLALSTLLNSAIHGNDRKELAYLGFALLVIFLFMSLTRTIGTYLLDASGDRLIIKLRKDLFSKILSMDYLFFHNQSLGNLASRLHSDTAAIRSATTRTIATLLNESLLFTGAVVVMAVMDWKLTLIVLCLAPIATLLSFTFGPKISNYSRSVRDSTANALGVATEGIDGIESVKIFSQEDHIDAKYSCVIDNALFYSLRLRKLRSVFSGSLSFLSGMVTVAIFWYGGIRVMSGDLSAGNLIAFLFYAGNITESLSAFGSMFSNIASAFGSSARIFELMDLLPSISDPARAVRTACKRKSRYDYTCEVDNVYYGYSSERAVLSGVSLGVQRGEAVAMVGRNGSGKTTLARLICRLLEPQSGHIFLDGFDIRSIPIRDLHKRVAMVSQDPFLFDMSVLDNVRLSSPGANEVDVMTAIRNASVDEFASMLPDGLNTMVGERGVRLSGGQRRRISLARALLQSSEVLILDEATSDVDVHATYEVVTSLVDEVHRDSMSLLVITHDVNVVKRCDRVVVLRDGSIVENTSIKEMLSTSDLFANIRADCRP